ncbi:hypothetical protein RFI_10552, partial [Reticulomyxa filosa]
MSEMIEHNVMTRFLFFLVDVTVLFDNSNFKTKLSDYRPQSTYGRQIITTEDNPRFPNFYLETPPPPPTTKAFNLSIFFLKHVNTNLFQERNCNLIEEFKKIIIIITTMKNSMHIIIFLNFVGFDKKMKLGLTRSLLLTVLCGLGRCTSSGLLHELFSSLDLNGDSVLTPSELLEINENVPDKEAEQGRYNELLKMMESKSLSIFEGKTELSREDFVSFFEDDVRYGTTIYSVYPQQIRLSYTEDAKNGELLATWITNYDTYGSVVVYSTDADLWKSGEQRISYGTNSTYDVGIFGGWHGRIHYA